MSFKLAVLFACVAVISCGQFETKEAFNNQHETFQQLNDQRRFHEQDKFEENRQFHNQDRFDDDRRNDGRFHYQQNFNNRGTFEQLVTPQNPTFFHLQPAVYNFQSSSHHVNVKDDSNYDVAYSVSDMSTGDIKSHKETRRGDEVQGEYTILDSDGQFRKVNYRANDRDGFDAEVKREPVSGFGFSSNYQGHHNQHNFNQFPSNQQFQNNFNAEQFHKQQFVAIPKSVATTSVSKTEDGQHNQYTTTTTNN